MSQLILMHRPTLKLHDQSLREQDCTSRVGVVKRKRGTLLCGAINLCLGVTIAFVLTRASSSHTCDCHLGCAAKKSCSWEWKSSKRE
eukprot:2635023-Amphidinium_carterae.1